MPVQTQAWNEFLTCPVCLDAFDSIYHKPVSLPCGHTICKQCLQKLQQQKCPLDQSLVNTELDLLPVNSALLRLVDGNLQHSQEVDAFVEAGPTIRAAWKCIEDIGSYMRTTSAASSLLSRPMQRKIILLITCQLVEAEGQERAMRAARSLGERTVMELILQHQNPQQLSSNLWAAVRTRGCQFLGPAMQEDVLKLVLLALEDGSALSRKVLVLFVVQRLERNYCQASKTAIGHVVQLLYRASCFQVTKRDEESSLMQLKEEFRNYDSLRREHDSQIVQIAVEAGLRIAPDQWSSLLYGDSAHKSHMQSIIDKLQTPESFSQSVSELVIALQRSGDPGNLMVLRPHFDLLANIDPNAAAPSWENLAAVMRAVKICVDGLVSFIQGQHNDKSSGAILLNNPKYKTSLCRDFSTKGNCPRGTTCNFAHSEEELERYRMKNKRSLMNSNMGNEKINSPIHFSKKLKELNTSTDSLNSLSQSLEDWDNDSFESGTTSGNTGAPLKPMYGIAPPQYSEKPHYLEYGGMPSVTPQMNHTPGPGPGPHYDINPYNPGYYMPPQQSLGPPQQQMYPPMPQPLPPPSQGGYPPVYGHHPVYNPHRLPGYLPPPHGATHSTPRQSMGAYPGVHQMAPQSYSGYPVYDGYYGYPHPAPPVPYPVKSGWTEPEDPHHMKLEQMHQSSPEKTLNDLRRRREELLARLKKPPLPLEYSAESDYIVKNDIVFPPQQVPLRGKVGDSYASNKAVQNLDDFEYPESTLRHHVPLSDPHEEQVIRVRSTQHGSSEPMTLWRKAPEESRLHISDEDEIIPFGEPFVSKYGPISRNSRIESHTKQSLPVQVTARQGKITTPVNTVNPSDRPFAAAYQQPSRFPQSTDITTAPETISESKGISPQGAMVASSLPSIYKRGVTGSQGYPDIETLGVMKEKVKNLPGLSKPAAGSTAEREQLKQELKAIDQQIHTKVIHRELQFIECEITKREDEVELEKNDLAIARQLQEMENQAGVPAPAPSSYAGSSVHSAGRTRQLKEQEEEDHRLAEATQQIENMTINQQKRHDLEIKDRMFAEQVALAEARKQGFSVIGEGVNMAGPHNYVDAPLAEEPLEMGSNLSSNVEEDSSPPSDGM